MPPSRPGRPPRKPLRPLDTPDRRRTAGRLSTVELEWELLASLDFFYRRNL